MKSKNIFPELALEHHKEVVLTSIDDLKLNVETLEEFFILDEVFIEKDGD